jgi:hypothetical protein
MVIGQTRLMATLPFTIPMAITLLSCLNGNNFREHGWHTHATHYVVVEWQANSQALTEVNEE